MAPATAPATMVETPDHASRDTPLNGVSLSAHSDAHNHFASGSSAQPADNASAASLPREKPAKKKKKKNKKAPVAAAETVTPEADSADDSRLPWSERLDEEMSEPENGGAGQINGRNHGHSQSVVDASESASVASSSRIKYKRGGRKKKSHMSAVEETGLPWSLRTGRLGEDVGGLEVGEKTVEEESEERERLEEEQRLKREKKKAKAKAKKERLVKQKLEDMEKEKEMEKEEEKVMEKSEEKAEEKIEEKGKQIMEKTEEEVEAERKEMERKEIERKEKRERKLQAKRERKEKLKMEAKEARKMEAMDRQKMEEIESQKMAEMEKEEEAEKAKEKETVKETKKVAEKEKEADKEAPDTGIRAFNLKRAAESGRAFGITINRGDDDDAGDKEGTKSQKKSEKKEEGEGSKGDKKKPVSIRLDLNLEVEIFLKAAIKGDVTITFLE